MTEVMAARGPALKMMKVFIGAIGPRVMVPAGEMSDVRAIAAQSGEQAARILGCGPVWFSQFFGECEVEDIRSAALARPLQVLAPAPAPAREMSGLVWFPSHDMQLKLQSAKVVSLDAFRCKRLP